MTTIEGDNKMSEQGQNISPKVYGDARFIPNTLVGYDGNGDPSYRDSENRWWFAFFLEKNYPERIKEFEQRKQLLEDAEIKRAVPRTTGNIQPCAGKPQDAIREIPSNGLADFYTFNAKELERISDDILSKHFGPTHSVRTQINTMVGTLYKLAEIARK
jgi:hypothetical protein